MVKLLARDFEESRRNQHMCAYILHMKHSAGCLKYFTLHYPHNNILSSFHFQMRKLRSETLPMSEARSHIQSDFESRSMKHNCWRLLNTKITNIKSPPPHENSVVGGVNGIKLYANKY